MQNKNYIIAPFGIRGIALIFDSIYAYCAFYFLESSVDFSGLPFLESICFYYAIFGLPMVLLKGQSLGMKFFDIKVLIDGQELSRKRAVLYSLLGWWRFVEHWLKFWPSFYALKYKPSDFFTGLQYYIEVPE